MVSRLVEEAMMGMAEEAASRAGEEEEVESIMR
jgi:hypothetical protein